MMYYVGTFHPLPGKHPMPPGYNLTRAELLAMRYEKLPITVEHNGIRRAVSMLLAAGGTLTPAAVGAALDGLGGDSVPVGIVHRAAEGADGRFYVLFAVDAAFPVIPMLIRAGALRGLSLTHQVDTPPLALEISLCMRPARPECSVLRASPSLVDQLDYLSSLITRPAMDSKTPLQAAIDSMSETDKQLVTARFADLMAAIDKANNDIKTARDESAAAIAAAQEKAQQTATNTELFESQITMLCDQIDPSIRQAYFCEAKPMIQELTSEHSATVLRAADRMICACNKQMMEMRASAVSRPKRKAEAEPETEGDDPISRALAETFAV